MKTRSVRVSDFLLLSHALVAQNSATEDDEDKEKDNKNYHNHSPRLTPFISGRNTLPFNRRSRCPPKLIKRLDRKSVV